MKDTSLLPTLLLVAFVVLKLCHVIDWSWWWVMAPLWLPIIVALAYIFIVICKEALE